MICYENAIHEKLGHMVADDAKDITGCRAGLFTLLADVSISERISGDLHVNNRAFKVTCEKVFGKPKVNVTIVMQLLYLLGYLLRRNWQK